MAINRVFLIVLDSFGIGQAPDAASYGDHDCNTLKSIVGSPFYRTDQLQQLGLFNIEGITCGSKTAHPLGAFGRLQEQSKGKDTTIGHWEISGILSPNPLPTYPDGFPAELIKELEATLGRKLLCNKPYSGTAVIHDYGREHLASGDLIAYTSADSVLQLAAHEQIIAPEQLYHYCRQARSVLSGIHGVGRVIARPFTGSYPNFERTPRRHDFSLLPPGITMLDTLSESGLTTIGIGKIYDIFAGRGINRSQTITGNEDGMRQAIACLEEDFSGLCFVNLVDFDMKYGHRRDIDGYAKAASAFDLQLSQFMARMKPEDVLMITADHGCDPGAAGTDHTREYVPWLILGNQINAGIDLKTAPTFATIAATILDLFSLPITTAGQSVLPQILKQDPSEMRPNDANV